MIFTGGPTAPRIMRQFEPHPWCQGMLISVKTRRISAFFEPTDGFIGIPGLRKSESQSVLELRNDPHPNQGLVFNDENGDKKFFEVPHLEATPRSANSSRVPTHQIAILSTAQWIGRSTPVYAIGRHDAGNRSAQAARVAVGGGRVAICLGHSNVICYREKKSIKETRFKGPRKS